MEPALENRFKTMRNDHRVLCAVKQLGKSQFTRIHIRVSCSTRTLAKHLKSLNQRGMIESRNSKYWITGTGLQFVKQLEEELEAFRRYQKVTKSINPSVPLVDLVVEVSRIQPSGHIAAGIIQVSAGCTIGLKERQELRKALSQVIRIISSTIPKETRRYHVLVSGSLR